MDFVIFILISSLVILSIILLLRYRLRKLRNDSNVSDELKEDNPGPSKVFNQAKWYFLFGGVLLIIFGFIHVFGFFTGEFTYLKLWDAIFNTSLGIIHMICFIYLNKRQMLVVWIYGFSILLSIGYGFVVGRGFNYFIAIFGAFIIYRLFELKKTNELE